MRILVIVNPVAKGGKTLRFLARVKRWLSESPHEFSFTIPKSPDEMCLEIMKAPSQGIDAFLFLGGDGTVHQALPAIVKTKIPFSLLPCGRGNDLARNVGLHVNLKRNCTIPSHPSLHSFDLPTINHIPFASVAYVGFDAEVNRLANQRKGYFDGTMGYIVCVLKALKKFRPFEVQITIDHYSWKERVMMVTIANGPFYGGGMKIAPNANINDGLLDICIVKEISKWELLRQFPKVFNGTHISHPKVLMTTGRRIKLISDEYREIFADGEYIGNLPAECSIGDQTLQVMSPF